eukprot:TRINITY_DN1518_c0_g1_i8.p1 TRINITY_DN1518_c0_g1~~TRINITY_DN1518_c0_g1_i8.p1  ORF type:complete len:148 (+),score=19.97 TRINITY_DN1518_c0_g1_i8:270-713(+)
MRWQCRATAGATAPYGSWNANNRNVSSHNVSSRCAANNDTININVFDNFPAKASLALAAQIAKYIQSFVDSMHIGGMRACYGTLMLRARVAQNRNLRAVDANSAALHSWCTDKCRIALSVNSSKCASASLIKPCASADGRGGVCRVR